MIRFDKDSLRQIFNTVNPRSCSISSQDHVFEIINGAAYKDMQPRHFSGIGNYREQREAVFRELSKRFVDFMNSSFSEIDFDEWHATQCKFLHDKFAGIKDEYGDIMTVGKAQKLINITFKHLYFFSDAEDICFNHCHVTLDSFVIDWANNNLGLNIKTVWSKLGLKEYFEIQSSFRNKLKNFESFKDATCFLAEFYIWEEAKLCLRKKAKDKENELWISPSQIEKWLLLLQHHPIRKLFREKGLEKQIHQIHSGIEDMNTILNN